MTELKALLDQQVAIAAEIAKRKPEAIAAIRELMDASGVTLEDLGAARAGRRGKPPASVPTGKKRPIKYRNDAGETWTGVGQRPRWVQQALAAGHELSDFTVAAPKA
jgi:DNA-binding protein H-NS